MSGLLDVVRAQKRGEALGLYSVCSANRFVLEAAMLQAMADGSVACIESTSNQVNPRGGYSGLTPLDFVRFAGEVARDTGFPLERVLLGGDHLGPFPYRHEPVRRAMDGAREMVRQYVLSGYVKIHLDASMGCADDPPAALSDETAMERAADLCLIAESAHAERGGGSPAPLYVIGTEVPAPGGESGPTDHLAVTRVEDAAHTLEVARAAFRQRGLERAFERVVGLVVQPGVEFGEAKVFDYDASRTGPLRDLIRSQAGLVFEAHSTDYQTADALRQLVLDQFAILKVGPALTFAFREAVFALAAIEQEWLGRRRGVTLSNLRQVLDEVMLARPDHWAAYHQGDEEQRRFARLFSLSDRVRYYWPEPAVEAALSRLLTNLSEHPASPLLISQYFPAEFDALRQGRVPAAPRRLIHLRILEVMARYARACGLRSAEREPQEAREPGAKIRACTAEG
jgi:D-tagatose-1,6-bisphosphate aldolase subunit GatZ/KbaZ